MKIITTELPGVLVIEPRVLSDKRGFFLESYHVERYAQAGLPAHFVQDNHSASVPGTIRGLHYQLKQPQGKLVRVVRGSVFDVAVDIRKGSPTFGRWIGVTLSAANKRQIFIPAGFAHGFGVPNEASEVEYKCTAYYAPEDEHGVRWDDPTLAIQWPIQKPIVSEKDRGYGVISSDRQDLPMYEFTVP